YGIAIGLLAFLACTFFLVMDLYFQQIRATTKFQGADCFFCLTGFWSFLWFVAFCFLANQWQRTPDSKGASQGGDAARAAIAFSFFSIISWVRKASFGLLPLPTRFQAELGYLPASLISLRGIGGEPP
uniref:Synaptogyrin 3 n=1 Tax=Naja naja TaxID=35670 RepID=A0A8C6XKP5_NAJNA